MPKNDNTVLMEGVQIRFRNFRGEAGPFNRPGERHGERNFAVLIDDDLAATMAEDGWNIKWLQPRGEEEGETPQAYLPVAIRFDIRPPRVVLITTRGRTNLDEGSIEMLDWADIVNVDLIVRPYPWEVNEKKGIKAYVQSLYVTIEEDPLEMKYNQLDQA